MTQSWQAEVAQFLAQNKEREGVLVTESGLQYKVIEEGSGKNPGPGNTVTVHYQGTLQDGTEFDSSYKRQAPLEFPVNGVIQGWQEGLQLMREGSKYELFIPPELGYGSAGAGGVIPPHALLIFTVELLKVR